MQIIFAIALLGAVVLAQHHHFDPFEGSGCDCERFCRYECSINGTKTPDKMTIYRMTMKDVYDLTDKDSGDVAGDVSFVLSKKNNAFYCRQNPGDFMCNDLAQFSGDDANSTDLILEMVIETDGQWGVYLECNPLNASDSTGRWSCENGLKPPPSPNFPAQCRNVHFKNYDGYCLTGQPDHVVTGTQEKCCEYIGTQAVGTFSAYNFFPNNNTCSLYRDALHTEKCDPHIVLGFYDAPDPNVCECERIYKAVGRQNQSAHSSSYNLAGGLWFSHPSGGECSALQKLGDGGCTYKLLDIPRAINATCMYQTIDHYIEGLNPNCFGQCPKPYNVTSDCYLGCYSNTTSSVPKTALLKPWGTAFDGCPKVHLDHNADRMLNFHY